MGSVPKYEIIEIRPDTMESIRKMYNLDQPGRVEEAIRMLREWVEKQPHFNKKDFSDQYLEIIIYVCKGSVERAKERMDKLCTIRTLMPNLFGIYNCKTDFEYLHDVVRTVLLPKLTDDHRRVYVTRFFDVDFDTSQTLHFYRHSVIFSEYIRANDFFGGYIGILDFSQGSIVNLLKKSNPVQVRQLLTIYVEGYAVSIKAIHIISESKFVDGVVTLLKQVVSAKVGDRIHVHKSFEGLHEFIQKDILPIEYGGEERSLDTLHEEWIEELSSERHLKHLEEMSKATTNESLRPKDQFLEQYGGMPGTFRFMNVD